MNFAEKIINFNNQLEFTGALPEKVGVMNPFRENEHALNVSSEFYRKFYADNRQRRIILGINPGRFGAGVTGIPFTDTKRLTENCNIDFPGATTHEPSSVFIYRMIDAYGGPEKFYGDFYITSLSPLGYVIENNKGKAVNYNYYDSSQMIEASRDFIVETLKEQIDFGFDTEVCYCLGTGKNFHFLKKLNKEFSFFTKLIPLEHPRYVMQYRSKQLDFYIEKYIDNFK